MSPPASPKEWISFRRALEESTIQRPRLSQSYVPASSHSTFSEATIATHRPSGDQDCCQTDPLERKTVLTRPLVRSRMRKRWGLVDSEYSRKASRPPSGDQCGSRPWSVSGPSLRILVPSGRIVMRRSAPNPKAMSRPSGDQSAEPIVHSGAPTPFGARRSDRALRVSATTSQRPRRTPPRRRGTPRSNTTRLASGDQDGEPS